MFKLKNGKEIPKLALGTYLCQGEALANAVDAALKAGYRHFDTAKYYENEKDLGNALEHKLPLHSLRTEDLFLTTKVFPYSSPDAADKIAQDIEESLMLLGRTYLDLVLIHYPRPLETNDKDPNNKNYRKEAWLALEKLQKSGKILSLGVSNYEICHIKEMKAYQTIEPQVNQCEYHPHFQRTPLKKYCQENGILFQAFSPLGRQKKELLEDETIVKIAKGHQTSTPPLILNWILHGKVGVVAKSITPTRVTENYKALKLEISDEEFARINELDRNQPYVEDNGWECI